jgi:hypothetical protein
MRAYISLSTVRPVGARSPQRAGVAVDLGEGPPLGRSAAIVLTPDGRLVEQPDSNEVFTFDLRLFVDLDDGTRVVDDWPSVGPTMTLSTPITGPDGRRLTRDEFESGIRAEVFDEELVEFAPGPDWRGLVAALATCGVIADPVELEALPFTVECESAVLGLLREERGSTRP